MFFFFKQKTAYEMRISDWSSDVCSSDLPRRCASAARQSGRPTARATSAWVPACRAKASRPSSRVSAAPDGPAAADRKSVVEGKRVSVREALGGSRIIKKKNNIPQNAPINTSPINNEQ